MIPRIGGIKQRTGYISLLKTFYGFYHPLEQKIGGFIDASVIPDMDQRRGSSLIMADLHALGADVSLMPQAKQLPALSNAALAMGALYVLEGSTLGGRYIANMLSRQVDPPLQKDELRFFTGYGPQTGIKWTSFVAILNEYASDEYTISQMVDAANQTFLHLNLWFTSQHA